MNPKWGLVLVAVGVLAGAGSRPGLAAAEKAACPPEVTQAQAMLVRADKALKGEKTEGPLLARTPAGDPASGAGVAPAPPAGTSTGGGRSLPGESAGPARGLATSAASDVSPWNPRPTDKTLKARATTARKLTAEARKLCAAGKMAEARAKAAEAIAVLDPK